MVGGQPHKSHVNYTGIAAVQSRDETAWYTQTIIPHVLGRDVEKSATGRNRGKRPHIHKNVSKCRRKVAVEALFKLNFWYHSHRSTGSPACISQRTGSSSFSAVLICRVKGMDIRASYIDRDPYKCQTLPNLIPASSARRRRVLPASSVLPGSQELHPLLEMHPHQVPELS